MFSYRHTSLPLTPPSLPLLWKPMLSISQNVRLSFRLCVCSLLRYCLNVLLPPLPKVGCSIFFRDSESLGKSNGKKWCQIWIFLFGSGLKSMRKKVCFFADFALQNMVEITLPDGFWHISRRFEFLHFGWFFPLKINWGFGILGPPGNHASPWIRDHWSKGL